MIEFLVSWLYYCLFVCAILLGLALVAKLADSRVGKTMANIIRILVICALFGVGIWKWSRSIDDVLVKRFLFESCLLFPCNHPTIFMSISLVILITIKIQEYRANKENSFYEKMGMTRVEYERWHYELTHDDVELYDRK